MFCEKCGKEIIDGAAFCSGCGAPTGGSPAKEQEKVQPNGSPAEAPKASENNSTPITYAAPQVNNAANVGQGGYPAGAGGNVQPKQRKKLGTGAVVAIVVAAAVVVIALVVLYFLFWHNGGAINGGNSGENSGGSSGQSSVSGGGSSVQFPGIGGGSSQPVQTEQLTMTVNGENIPVEFSGFAYGDVETGSYGYAACFLGRKGSELYGVQALFLTEEDPDCPSANTTYDPLSSKYEDTVAVQFSYMDASKGAEIHTVSYSGDFESALVFVSDFIPNEKMKLSVRGKTSDDGLTFDFSVSGSPQYYSNLEKISEEVDAIADSVRSSGRSASSNNGSPKEVEIAGKTYPVSTTFIDLSNQGLRDSDIQNIKYLKNLTRAELSGNNLTDISVLGNITSLEEIDAKDNNIYDISFMKNLPNLKIVVMNNNPIRDISVFSNFTTIEKLWFCECYITDISPIAKNKGMTELGFNNCNLKGNISALQGMRKLEILSLYNCGLTDINVLSSCTGLKKLYIGGNSISDYSPIDGLDLEEVALF